MAELFRVLLVTLLLCLFWLPSGLSEPDAEESAGASAKFKPLDPPMQVSKGGDGNGGNSGGPKKVYPSDEEGHVVPPGWPEKGGGDTSKDGGSNGRAKEGDGSDFRGRGGKGGGDTSKDGDPPGYCRCNTAGRHVQSVVLGLFLLTFGVCLTWIEL